MMTRREWCTQLATLVSPSFPLEATKALHSMLPALSHLPDELFTDLSLMQVAQVRRRQSVPAWDEIITALHDYRRTFLPDPTLRIAAPALPDRQAPSPEEVAVVAEMLTTWRKQAAEDALAREWAKPPGAESKPLRDVTAKGETLRSMRAARGITMPEPMSADDVYGEVAPA